MAMQHCDVLIAIGARFDDRVIGDPNHFASRPRKIIHIDIDPSSISKRVKVDIPIVGDVKEVLKELIEQLQTAEHGPDTAALADWWKDIEGWRSKDCLKFDRKSDIIKPQYVVEKAWELTDGNAFVCSDVGQHQMWAAQLIRFNEPRLWINSGGLGAMGFGLPSAIGAQFARPDKLVFAICGDGGFQMSIPELATIASHRLPIKMIVMNNGYLGMVRQWQTLFYNNRLSSVELDCFPDVEKLAGAYGIKGRTVTHPGELAHALRIAIDEPGPYLLDVRVTPMENVYPMVPAGGAINEMVLGDLTGARK
jgi:acetolactate synthase-1/2/3 large subunit